ILARSARMRRLALLLGGSLALWLLAALPARAVWGDVAVIHSGTAVLLCLVPAAATLLWADRAASPGPHHQFFALLGGTRVRLFVVLAGALALQQWVPYFGEQPGFWVWLLLFYFATLALELTLVLARRGAPSGS